MSQSSARRLQSHPSSAAGQVEVGGGVGGKRGHQRRQSVARLLPDISKLRLLSWLVEASSELIQCDIAIMDGVYAKLNRSRESLLFWSSSHNQQQALGGQHQQQVSPPARPAPPTKQPVANRLVISLQEQQQQQHHHHQQRNQKLLASTRSSARNHHSLPITNYDASSLAAVSIGSRSVRQPEAAARRLRGQASGNKVGASSSLPPQLARPTTTTSDSQHQQEEDSCDSQQSEEEDDEEDDDSSATSSTSSSGIHGGDTSLSSAASTCSSSTSNSSAGSSSETDLQSPLHRRPAATNQSITSQQRPPASSAEQLSEKIRKTVMEHNYLQNLLVNIIRQHDRQRDLLNQQRRRQLSMDSSQLGRPHQQHHYHHLHLQRIDLADIADALDDGCLCVCHSRRDPAPAAKPGRSSTLPVAGKAEAEQAPSRKARRLKKANGGRGGSSINANTNGSGSKTGGGQGNTLPASLSGGGGSNEINRQDIINLLADKLCENCFETHYWLHGCSMELSQPAPKNRHQQDQQQSISAAGLVATATGSSQDLNAIISKRNATFIKLVQQEVRSTISKSIELIDLIRKEIKLPESIKQKQLMRCFSTSIQLLTSVGNYVVPSQDISSFIPEVGHQQTTLFSLPSSDFEHLLLYPPSLAQAVNLHHLNSSSSNNNNHHQAHNTTASAHYHLAQAPDIPIRRRLNPLLSAAAAAATMSASPSKRQQVVGQSQNRLLTLDGLGGGGGGSPIAGERNQNRRHGSLDGQTEQSLSSNFQKLKTTPAMAPATDTTTATTPTATNTTDKPGTGIISTTGPTTGSTAPATVTGAAAATTNDSSSGASSNNSSASSSIARGTVQQSSLTRAHTSSALLDGKTSHDLSFETIASLSRQHTEDDMLFQSRPKFWQSSKFNFIKKLLHVKQQRLLRQQSKDRRIYNNKVQNKFRLVMMDLTHFNKSQQLLTTENGVNSLLTSMRNVLEFGLYLTLKLY